MSMSKRLLNLFKKFSVQGPSAQQAEKDVVCPLPKDSTQQTEKDAVCPESKVYNCADVYVLLVTSVSNISDGSGCGPRCFDFYLAGTKVEDKYYELFSGVELKTSCNYFNTPYIKEVKPLKEYLTNPKLSKIDGQLLFGFLSELNSDIIMEMLIDLVLKILSDKEREAQDCNAEDEDE